MTDKEVQLFLADLAVIIILARLLGLAAKRLGQPPVLGEITVGILLGPTLFHGKITATLFPVTLRPALSALANLGVVMFMFVVGYELDLRLLRGRERVAASVSVSSVILPLSLGTGLGAWLASRHHVHHVLPFALFVGTAAPVQHAAALAFSDSPPISRRIASSRALHASIARAVAGVCTAAGLVVPPPQAAFYVCPDFDPWRDHLRSRYQVTTAAGLARLLLRRYGAATLPGSAFGESPSALRLRLATSLLCGDTSQQQEAALTAPDPTTLPWIAAALTQLGPASPASRAGALNRRGWLFAIRGQPDGYRLHSWRSGPRWLRLR
jgi:hypothetical protein